MQKLTFLPARALCRSYPPKAGRIRPKDPIPLLKWHHRYLNKMVSTKSPTYAVGLLGFWGDSAMLKSLVVVLVMWNESREEAVWTPKYRNCSNPMFERLDDA